MSGLPHANHFYDDTDFGRPGVKLLMNEFFVTSEDMVLSTVLGSCVSACIRDPGMGIGGMNHFMLPDAAGDPTRGTSDAMRYGAYAMEVLINQLLKGGARRAHLEAKVFGGAAVLKRMHTLNIGDDNSRFVRRYLALEGIRIVAEDLQGEHPRKVCFMPATGQVMVKKLPLDVRVTAPTLSNARAGSVALEQRERAMAEQSRLLSQRRASSAGAATSSHPALASRDSDTAQVFQRGMVHARNAAVVARPVAQAPRVELFFRTPTPVPLPETT